MRIVRLDLTRYGHFQDRSLVFPPVPLAVVLGPNEAGKSTALAAIGDALFGFPHLVERDFRHKAADQRVGIVLVGADGTEAAFERRRGRARTLSRDGVEVEDAAMTRLVDGLDRRRFSALFGLDHDSLRSGAAALVGDDAELGRLLFEAAGRLRGLGQLQARLRQETEALFTERSRQAVIDKALRALQEQTRALGEATLKEGEWERARRLFQAADEALATAEASRQEARQSLERLERRRRLMPLAARRAQLLAERADLPPGPALDPGAATALAAAAEAAARAVEARRHAEAALTRARGELEGALVPAPVLAAAGEITALTEALGGILKADADRPNRQGERAAAEERLMAAARRLGLAGTAAALLARLPPLPLRQEARSLARQREEAAAEAARHNVQREAALAAQMRDQEALAALAAVPDLAAAAEAVDALGALGAVGAEAARLQARAAAEAGRAAAACRSLPGWSGDGAALASAPVPSPATVTRAGQAWSEAEAALARARAERARLDGEAATLDQQRRRLEAAGPVPDRARIEAARGRRDALWDLVRRRHVAGLAVPSEELRALAGGFDLAEALTGAIAAADQLSDRALAEGERVGEHAALLRQQADNAAARHEAGRREAAAEQALATLDAAWRAPWQAAGILALSPPEMADWLTRRERALEAVALAEAAAGEAARAEARRVEGTRLAASATAALGIDPPPSLPQGGARQPDPPEAALPLLRRALAAARDTAAERQRLAERLAEAAETLARLGEAARRLEAQSAAAAARWPLVAGACALGAADGQAAVDAALAQWDEIDKAQEARRELDHRLTRMNEDLAAFTQRVEALGRRLGEDAPDPDPRVRVRRLAQRLDAARRAEERRAILDQAAAAAVAQLETAAEAAEAAARRLARLRAEAGLPEEGPLGPLLTAARRRAELDAALAEATAAILDAADGLDLEGALAEVAAAGPAEALIVDAQATAQRLDGLAEARDRAADARDGARRALAELERERDAAGTAERIEVQRRQLEGLARRWLTLSAAQTLLRSAAERFRASAEEPVLAEAAALFRVMTGGSFVDLEAQVDAQERRQLRGLRADGSGCEPREMSAGTADQLFLALRLAAIRHHARASGPMPLIGDDILVQFDDRRAAATLKALMTLGEDLPAGPAGGLGGGLQVILFTHHAHIAALAADQGAAVLRLQP